VTQNQGWDQPPNQSGWGQQPQQPPPGQPQQPPPPPPPGQQPPYWQPPPGPGGYGGGVYQESKSRPLAILLALLLGGFGIHRFYVGPISWGIAYLVFFWTGIPAFLGWLEAIYWLTRNDVEWAAKYGGPVRRSNGLALGCLWIVALLPILAILLAILAVPGLILLGGEISEILSEIEVNLATPAP
jgi:TM2 domain-containing membrane protein YozV